jgi:hypothetical protein
MRQMSPPTTERRPSRGVRRAGLVVLAIGLAVAALIGLMSHPPDFEDGVDSHEASAIERIGGTATVRAVQLDQWLASLWHGERLAWTIALLSLAVCGGCFYVASLMDEDVGDDEDAGDRRGGSA